MDNLQCDIELNAESKFSIKEEPIDAYDGLRVWGNLNDHLLQVNEQVNGVNSADLHQQFEATSVKKDIDEEKIEEFCGSEPELKYDQWVKLKNNTQENIIEKLSSKNEPDAMNEILSSSPVYASSASFKEKDEQKGSNGMGTCNSSDTTVKKAFGCTVCTFATHRKDNLKTHQLIHSQTKLFKCSECSYAGNRPRDLKTHALVHTDIKRYQCSQCEYKCNYKSSLKNHVLSHSGSNKMFKCSECDFKCSRSYSLKRHFLTHSNMKTFKCFECDYLCNRKSSLIRHLVIHSNKKLFRCTECEYECNQKHALTLHQLTHSGTKLFSCPHCDYKCNRKGNLNIHILSHSESKLFRCPKCEYECNQRNRLRQHLLTHERTRKKNSSNGMKHGGNGSTPIINKQITNCEDAGIMNIKAQVFDFCSSD